MEGYSASYKQVTKAHEMYVAELKQQTVLDMLKEFRRTRTCCCSRVILILMNFRISILAGSHVDHIASLVSEQFLFSL